MYTNISSIPLSLSLSFVRAVITSFNTVCSATLPSHHSCRYLATVAEVLPSVLNLFRPDLVLYDAGVDIHKADHLGKLQVWTCRSVWVSAACILHAVLHEIVFCPRINTWNLPDLFVFLITGFRWGFVKERTPGTGHLLELRHPCGRCDSVNNVEWGQVNDLSFAVLSALYVSAVSLCALSRSRI
jgi:hypothetical protein